MFSRVRKESFRNRFLFNILVGRVWRFFRIVGLVEEIVFFLESKGEVVSREVFIEVL